jgi:hypothetical protein
MHLSGVFTAKNAKRAKGRETNRLF